ncbi:bifunctional 2-polyprenyl-6-hydroxyphenol methylase/3-demethylubiquinol 3-O-methyltransferase UbiG [Kineosporia sp. A_224]|uniref:class I SAM-dependent methyltransferase n=1 Tax=Kineosporia sp. A_224 TaxID=1962180 RepID=UPI000B4C1586|nr:class I SAM-dependent methyltransferase [Kineosporia sp. A_224]
MPVDVDPALLPERGLRRSVALLRAFRLEQSRPDVFYSTLAVDTVRQVSRYTSLDGASVVDVGGGPGYFADAFRGAGARYAGIDPDAGELTARGDAPEGFLRASGLALPLADGSLDVCMSSNVLEHVPDPERMAGEMLRVVRPGGLVWLSWTTWLSPWGGHETSPWHYLGGRRAADRYERLHGRRPKNDFGRSLFAVSAGRMSRWAREVAGSGAGEVLDVRARYHPDWAAWVARVPAAREVVSWNVVVVVRRR